MYGNIEKRETNAILQGRHGESASEYAWQKAVVFCIATGVTTALQDDFIPAEVLYTIICADIL